MRERYELGLDLRELTAAAGVPLVVNDRVDIAQAIGASASSSSRILLLCSSVFSRVVTNADSFSCSPGSTASMD